MPPVAVTVAEPLVLQLFVDETDIVGGAVTVTVIAARSLSVQLPKPERD